VVADASKSLSEFDVRLVDLADFDLPLLDEPAHPRLQQYQKDHTRRWSESVASADAFFSSPPSTTTFRTPH
jgi:NAD(P)H-dependent FMN reductase